MKPWRLLLAFVATGSLSLVSPSAALAKDDIRARLTTALPAIAPAGTSITVGWTLVTRDEHSHEHPFDASMMALRVLVRLVGAPGTAPTIRFAAASDHTDGR